MPSGISLPVRANLGGGLSIASGNEQDRNVISLALASNDNENAFQQSIGLGQDMIFEINDPAARADKLAKLRRVFDRFERLKRFKLIENTIRWDDGAVDGESVLAFKYIALESDSIRDFDQKYSSPTGANTSANR
jgi:hypothetical protein